MPVRFRSLLIATALISLGSAGSALAQSSAPKFEVGGQFSAIHLSDFAATNAGLGGRFSYDPLRWMTLESEFTLFPNDDVTVMGSVPELGTIYRRRRAEAFFGPKMGVRNQRIGLFGKVRPGFTSLSDQGVDCAGDVCALISTRLLAVPEYRTEFALDLGGVLEFYPSPRTILRFDIGDTMVWHRSSAPPCWGESCTSNNFSSRFGFGFRF